MCSECCDGGFITSAWLSKSSGVGTGLCLQPPPLPRAPGGVESSTPRITSLASALILVTQDVTRVSEALCQEWKTKTKCRSYSYHTRCSRGSGCHSFRVRPRLVYTTFSTGCTCTWHPDAGRPLRGGTALRLWEPGDMGPTPLPCILGLGTV